MARPLRALVVEDEWPARNYLVELLETSGLAEVVGAVGSMEEARQALTGDESGLGIDVAFVDVQIDGAPRGETGLSLVRSMAHSERAPMFVLATAYEEHALEAYELGVVDYLDRGSAGAAGGPAWLRRGREQFAGTRNPEGSGPRAGPARACRDVDRCRECR